MFKVRSFYTHFERFLPNVAAKRLTIPFRIHGVPCLKPGPETGSPDKSFAIVFSHDRFLP
jgi:hypothetical protein